MAISETFNFIRLTPRDTEFLNRRFGARGEIFLDRESQSLRIFNGSDQSGIELAKTDLTNISNVDLLSKVTLAGVIGLNSIYTADETLDWAQGSYDFGNNILKYANAVQLESELANYSPSIYHGMTMHVHETGALYFAHAGEWRKLLVDTSYNDPISAGYTDPLGTVAYSNDYDDLDNTPQIITSILDLGVTDGTSGQVLTTDGDGNFTFTDVSGGVSDAFTAVSSDDGAFTSESVQTLAIIGGTNIATEVVTDSDQLTINLQSFPISFLSNVSDSVPTSGQVLKWDGSQWAPGTDIAEGGTGLDADTLDGFEGTHYLDYSNFTNTPDVVTLTDLSVGNELTASGDGAISYDNTTGVFRYTPPDLSSYLTSVTFSDITDTPTTLSGYGITDAPSDLTDLGISDGTSGQVLTTDGSGNFTFTTVSGGDGATAFLDLSDTPESFGSSGQVVVVNGAGDGLIFTDTTNQNAFSNVAVTGQTTISADTATDTLTLTAGTGISIATDADTDTLTISSTVSGGATAFTGLSDVSTANITVDKIYLPAITMLEVDNQGASAYRFDQYGSTDNPTIYAINRTTIAFDLDVSGHPFLIQDPTGINYNTGLVHVASNGTVSTGADAQGQENGTLYWKIPSSISGNYRYQCSVHSVMVGAITIKDFASI